MMDRSFSAPKPIGAKLQVRRSLPFPFSQLRWEKVPEGRMRAAERSDAVVPHALQLSFKTHQDHVKNIVDVLVDAIVRYPDDAITFCPEIRGTTWCRGR
jgi:hypothetical protein